MLQDFSDQATQLILGEYVEWVKRFDVNDYLKNRPMIEKLYEEKQLALTKSMTMEAEVDDLRSKIHTLELRNQRLGLQLEDATRRSVSVFLLSLAATILVAIGVNVATSTPYEWAGWLMIIIGCLLEIMAFVITPRVDT